MHGFFFEKCFWKRFKPESIGATIFGMMNWLEGPCLYDANLHSDIFLGIETWDPNIRNQYYYHRYTP